MTRTLALEDGDIVENEWKAPAPVLDPTAVTVGASVDGPLTFTSGATVVSEAGSITLDHAERSTVCATSDGLYAFRTVEGDAAGTPDLDSVDLASPIPAALDRLVDGRWEPVSGSETTYRQDDSWSVDTSCGSRGPEIRAASSPALQWWDGDTWVAGTEEGVAWWLWSDDPPIELEPTIGRSSMTGIDRSGRLVAQSLADGEITMTAELPAGVGRFWETTEGAPPTGSFATNGKDAVVCRADASSDRPCDIWRVQ